VRILALGVRNAPKTSFSVNENAWRLFHPPRVSLPNEIEDIPADEPDTIGGKTGDRLRSVPGLCHGSKQNAQDFDVERCHPDPMDPGRLRYPTPVLYHCNYPMYTSGGFDRRWVNECELGRSDVKWVGNMMYDIALRVCSISTDVYSFPGWWPSLSDPTRWSPGLDHPSYKT